MRVLVACEKSGRVRDAFRARGHDAVSVDLEPSDRAGPHHCGDAVEYALRSGFWHLLIAFPPCTFLSLSGLHWNRRRPGRENDTARALEFVEALWRLPIKRKCLENPKGCINSRLPFMPRPQVIQPHWFGDDASKGTCLWLDNLPRLRRSASLAVPPRMVDVTGSDLLGDPVGTPRWANQNDKGQNNIPERKGRAAERAVTYHGVAEAMAEQWGNLAA